MTSENKKESSKNPEEQAEGVQIQFEDEQVMYGTSPVKSDLGDKELDHLTSQTLPRVRLSRSFRKIFMYISVFMIIVFLSHVCYYRTSEVTGLVPWPLYGLGEVGLVVVSIILSVGNFFMVVQKDLGPKLSHLVRFMASGLPLLILVALYTLPQSLIYKAAFFIH